MIAQQRAVIPIDTIEGTHIFTGFNLIFFQKKRFPNFFKPAHNLCERRGELFL